jgi:hypothetical protein
VPCREWGDRTVPLHAVKTDHLADAVTKMMPMRLRQVIGLEHADVHASGGDFVQVRLPEMIALFLDQRDVRPLALPELVAEPRRELQPTCATADDDDAM